MLFLGFCDDTGAWGFKHPEDVDRFIAEQFRGKDFSLDIKAATRKRSLAQNRFLWGHALPLIAEHLGYDHHEHDRLHYDLLSVRFGTQAILPMVPGAPPRIVPSKTSSELTTVEFAEYLEWLVRYAAEHFGVVIQLPDEREAA